MKPMLACDWDESKVRFPLMMQPKIDGVRGLNIVGNLTGRSLKPFKNRATTARFSLPEFHGLDGEFAANKETHPDLCRMTSSALSTIEGDPYALWWLFDDFSTDKPYHTRHQLLSDRVERFHKLGGPVYWRLRVVPYMIVQNMQQVEALDAAHLDAGFEGSILRDPNGRHKQGRSTVNEGGLLRIKRFVDAEAVVIQYEEGNTNDNEAQINELGRTFRTSHQENKTPNGQVGTIIAKDVVTGQIISVSPGNMPHDQRIEEWNNRHLAAGKVFTYKHFPKGRKDLPRFPTWKFWRDAVDMG